LHILHGVCYGLPDHRNQSRPVVVGSSEATARICPGAFSSPRVGAGPNTSSTTSSRATAYPPGSRPSPATSTRSATSSTCPASSFSSACHKSSSTGSTSSPSSTAVPAISSATNSASSTTYSTQSGAESASPGPATSFSSTTRIPGSRPHPSSCASSGANECLCQGPYSSQERKESPRQEFAYQLEMDLRHLASFSAGLLCALHSRGSGFTPNLQQTSESQQTER
jgi:hypothetical protein